MKTKIKYLTQIGFVVMSIIVLLLGFLEMIMGTEKYEERCLEEQQYSIYESEFKCPSDHPYAFVNLRESKKYNLVKCCAIVK